MGTGGIRCHTALRRAVQEAQTQQERLVDVLHCLNLFRQHSRERLDADGSRAKLLDDGRKQLAVCGVKTEIINVQDAHSLRHGPHVDPPVTVDLCVVSHAPDKAVDDARRTAAPAGDLRRFYEPAVAALAEMRTPFEINTAGWRKDCREQYPAREFLALAHAAQVPLLINSDAHAVEELGAGFPEAVALAKSVGYTQTARLHRREISFVALP